MDVSGWTFGRRALVLGLLSSLLLLGGTAAAKTNKLEATFEDAPTAASLSLSVKASKNGKLKKVTAIRYGAFPLKCDDTILAVNGAVPSVKITEANNRPYFNTNVEVPETHIYVSIIGFLNKKGTKVTEGEANIIDTDDANCTDRQLILTFTAK